MPEWVNPFCVEAKGMAEMLHTASSLCRSPDYSVRRANSFAEAAMGQIRDKYPDLLTKECKKLSDRIHKQIDLFAPFANSEIKGSTSLGKAVGQCISVIADHFGNPGGISRDFRKTSTYKHLSNVSALFLLGLFQIKEYAEATDRFSNSLPCTLEEYGGTPAGSEIDVTKCSLKEALLKACRDLDLYQSSSSHRGPGIYPSLCDSLFLSPLCPSPFRFRPLPHSGWQFQPQDAQEVYCIRRLTASSGVPTSEIFTVLCLNHVEAVSLAEVINNRLLQCCPTEEWEAIPLTRLPRAMALTKGTLTKNYMSQETTAAFLFVQEPYSGDYASDSKPTEFEFVFGVQSNEEMTNLEDGLPDANHFDPLENGLYVNLQKAAERSVLEILLKTIERVRERLEAAGAIAVSPEDLEKARAKNNECKDREQIVELLAEFDTTGFDVTKEALVDMIVRATKFRPISKKRCKIPGASTWGCFFYLLDTVTELDKKGMQEFWNCMDTDIWQMLGHPERIEQCNMKSSMIGNGIRRHREYLEREKQ